MIKTSGISSSDRFASIIGTLAILAFVATFFAGSRLLTIEADESWMLMSIMKAFRLDVPASGAIDFPVVTSGGLHLLIHGLLASLHGGIGVHRGVSLVFAMACMALTFALVKRHSESKTLAAVAAAAFATTPGFLLQASFATAEIIATAIFLSAAWFWVSCGARSTGHAALAGALFGLACATRMTCLAMLPAILLWSLVAHREWKARLLYPIVAIIVSVMVYSACVQAYIHAFSQVAWESFAPQLGAASGVGPGFKGMMGMLKSLLIGDGIVPILGLLVLAGSYVKAWPSAGGQGLVRLGSFLLIAGLVAWAAWIVRSPIAHVRYLWPALPLLWLSGILLMTAHLTRPGSSATRLLYFTAIAGLCLSHGLLNLRMLAVGESLTVVYEFARTTPVEVPRENFKAREHQEAVARVVGQQQPGARLYAINATAAYPITYLSGRTIEPLPSGQTVSDHDFLLVLPSNRHIWPASTELTSWMQTHARAVARQGDHVLYRLTPGSVLP